MNPHYIAQRITNPAIEGIGASSGAEFISKLIPALLSAAIVIGIIAFLFMFLSGGIQWMNAGGDQNALAAARKKVVNAVVGLFILLLFVGFMNILEVFFRTNLTEFDFASMRFGATTNPDVVGPFEGLAECPCGGPLGGGLCARDGQIGSLAGECYECTAGSGWVATGGTSCPPITCGTCP